MTAPACLARATAPASGARRPSSAFSPDEAGSPSTSKVSLIVIGRPASAPGGSPLARCSSMAPALSRARSRSVATTALISLLQAAWRRSVSSSSSTALIRRVSSACSWAVASRAVMSATAKAQDVLHVVEAGRLAGDPERRGQRAAGEQAAVPRRMREGEALVLGDEAHAVLADDAPAAQDGKADRALPPGAGQ